MEINSIFGDKLFAVKYDGEASDEFERMFDLWHDVEYLEGFFEENKKDLESGFWGTMTIEEAIIKTLDDALRFEKKAIILSKNSETEQRQGLESMFKPLHNSQTQVIELNKSKARQSWLRIYALRLEKNIYLITGGAIKLTATMQEREHTKHELGKLEKCRRFLMDQGIVDADGLIEEIEI